MSHPLPMREMVSCIEVVERLEELLSPKYACIIRLGTDNSIIHENAQFT